MKKKFTRSQVKALIGLAILLSAAAIIGFVYSQKRHVTTPVNTGSDVSAQNSIALDTATNLDVVALDDSSQPPQDTLATLKDSQAYQNPRTDLPYDKLFRNSEDYKGQYVRYTGKVVQVLGEPGEWNLRVNITKETSGSYDFWDDTVFVYSYSQERVIDDDIIEFTALVNGTITYESVLGGQITIPSSTIYEHMLVGSSR